MTKIPTPLPLEELEARFGALLKQLPPAKMAGKAEGRGRKRNLVGCIFDRLTVLAKADDRVFKSGFSAYWWCVCECGALKEINGSNLVTRQILSCGCKRVEVTRQQSIRHGAATTGKKTKTYRIWIGMKTRCENPNTNMFDRYMGRGIGVCEEWRASYETFLRDMGECPPGMSLDRIDNNKGYSKENCRWATRFQQANNTEKNRFFEYNGKRLTIAEWARELSVSPDLLRHRLLRHGPEKAFSSL